MVTPAVDFECKQVPPQPVRGIATSFYAIHENHDFENPIRIVVVRNPSGDRVPPDYIDTAVNHVSCRPTETRLIMRPVYCFWLNT